MRDAETYELNTFHCPEVCGYTATARAIECVPDAPCPRCGGARLREFWLDERLPMPAHPPEKGLAILS